MMLDLSRLYFGPSRLAAVAACLSVGLLVMALPDDAVADGSPFVILGGGTSSQSDGGGAERNTSGSDGARSFQQAGDLALLYGADPTFRSLETRKRSYISQVCDGYLVLGETNARKVRDPKRGSIIHIDSGNVVRRGDYGHDLVCSDGYLIGPERNEGPPWVMRTSDGRFFEPDWTLPRGASARVARMHPIHKPDQQTTEFLVSAFSKELDAWLHGAWSLGESSVAMRDQGMRLPTEARYVGDDILITFGPTLSGQTCKVQRVSSSGLSCAIRARGLSDAHFLGNGWVGVFSSMKAVVRSPSGEVQSLRPNACGGRFKTYSIGAEGDGVLTGCRDESNSSRYHFKFWSHGSSHEWTDSSGLTPRMGNGQVIGDVMALQETGRDGPIKGWLDLRSGQMWRSAALYPIDNKKTLQGRDALALATDKRSGAEIELHLLDFDRGTRKYVDTYDDCPGYLMEDGRHGSRVILRCISEPYPGKYVLRHHWSEVLDLGSGHRWRFDDKKPELFTGDGRVVYSDIGAKTDEWFATAGALWVAELEAAN